MILQFWLMLPYDSSVYWLEKQVKTTKFFVRSKDFPPSHGGPPTQIRYVRERRELELGFRFLYFPCLQCFPCQKSDC